MQSNRAPMTFRVCNDDRRIRKAHSEGGAPLDAGGLSQITQSNIWRSAVITRRTPSPVRASLSRVCEAGKCERVEALVADQGLRGLATPCVTLIKSSPTRLSAPITRSRFRRPTSKSTTTTLCPRLRQRRSQGRGRCGLPNAALPGSNNYDFSHCMRLLG